MSASVFVIIDRQHVMREYVVSLFTKLKSLYQMRKYLCYLE